MSAEEQWHGDDRRAPEGWHLKKEVSVGHLLTTITIAIGALAYIIQNEKNHAQHQIRIDTMQSIMVELKSSDLRQDAKMESAVSRIEQQLNRMDDKLERWMGNGRNNR